MSWSMWQPVVHRISLSVRISFFGRRRFSHRGMSDASIVWMPLVWRIRKYAITRGREDRLISDYRRKVNLLPRCVYRCNDHPGSLASFIVHTINGHARAIGSSMLPLIQRTGWTLPLSSKSSTAEECHVNMFGKQSKNTATWISKWLLNQSHVVYQFARYQLRSIYPTRLWILMRTIMFYTKGSGVPRSSQSMKSFISSKLLLHCRLENRAWTQWHRASFLLTKTWGVPLSINEMLNLAKTYASSLNKDRLFPSGTPSYDWLRSFLKRHSTLVLKKSSLLTKKRAGITAEQVNQWFRLLSSVIEDNHLASRPAQIFNADETGRSVSISLMNLLTLNSSSLTRYGRCH